MDFQHYREGIWEIGERHITAYYPNGPWTIEASQIEYFSERSFDAASVEVSVKAYGWDKANPIGIFPTSNSNLRRAMGDFASRNRLGYIFSEATGTARDAHQQQQHIQPPHNNVPNGQLSGGDGLLNGIGASGVRPAKPRRKLGKKIAIGGVGVVIALMLIGIISGSASRTLSPSDKQTDVEVGGVEVSLPAGTISEDTKITVKKDSDPPEIIPGKDKGLAVNAYDIELSSKVDVSGVAEISIPFDKGDLPSGIDPAQAVRALYYNPSDSKWVPMPCRVDMASGKLVIYTDHFSKYASVVIKDGSSELMATLPKYDYISSDFYDEATLRKVVEEGRAGDLNTKTAVRVGWDKFNERYGVTGAGSTLLESAVGTKLLKNINGMMNEAGLGFAVAQVAIDIYNEDYTAAKIDSVKSGMMYSISKWGGSALNLASVGVFAIDYSLNTFATTVLDANYKKYEDAYNEYYAKEPTVKRTTKDWYKLIYQYAKESKTPDDLKNRITAEVDRYAGLFWSDMAAAEYINKGRVGTSAGGMDTVEKQISQNYKAELYKTTIQVALHNVLRHMSFNAQMKAENDFEKVKRELDKVYVVRLEVKNPERVENLANVKAKFVNKSGESIHEATFDSTGHIDLKMSLFGFLKAGSPNKVVVTVPDFNGKKGKIVNTSFKLVDASKPLIVPVAVAEHDITGTWKVVRDDGGAAASPTITFYRNDNGTYSIAVANAYFKSAKAPAQSLSVTDGKVNVKFTYTVPASAGAAYTKGTVTLSLKFSADGKRLDGTLKETTYYSGGSSAQPSVPVHMVK